MRTTGNANMASPTRRVIAGGLPRRSPRHQRGDDRPLGSVITIGLYIGFRPLLARALLSFERSGLPFFRLAIGGVASVSISQLSLAPIVPEGGSTQPARMSGYSNVSGELGRSNEPAAECSLGEDPPSARMVILVVSRMGRSCYSHHCSPPESRRDGFLLASSDSGCVLSRESECEEFSGYRRSEVVQQRQGIRVYRSR